MRRIWLLLCLCLALLCGQSAIAQTQSTDNYLDYGKAVAALSQLAPKGTSSADIAASRLLLRASEPLEDLEDYGPLSVVAGPGHRYTLQFATPAEAQACMEALAQDSRIKYVHTDALVSLDEAEAEADQPTLEQAKLAAKADSPYMSWGAKAMGADELAASITRGGSVTVAVVDSGVAKHSFLDGRVRLGGADFVDSENTDGRQDGNGHGTHVAGTIVDLTQGLKVYILPVRTMDDQGYGYSSSIVNGIFYAADSGAQVINLSLGGTLSTAYGQDSVYTDAINYAQSQGAVVVVAAGNDNANAANTIPASLRQVITVAALDPDLSKASYSNYGNPIDVAAPGSSIVSCSTNGGFTDMSGTSMAAPHVSAIAAMIKLQHPGYSISQVDTYLKSHCLDLGDQGWDKLYGYGMPCFIDGNDEEQEADYAYRVVDGKAVITGYTGQESRIVLPQQLGGLEVSAVDEGAFRDNDAIVSVEVPGSIQQVGNYAFAGCAALEEVTLGEGFQKIGTHAFENCAALAQVSIPDSLRDIDTAAFSGCSSLTSIRLPDGLLSLGESAFAQSGLTSLSIPGSVKTIPSHLALKCASLETLTLNEGIATWGVQPFSGCPNLTQVTLPQSLTQVQDYGFSNLPLKELKVPGSTVLSPYAFYLSGIREIVLEEGITAIPDNAMMDNAALEKVVIPRSVASLGTDAFAGCPNLTLYLYAGSPAHDYAMENGIPFELVGYQAVLTGITPTMESIQTEPGQTILLPIDVVADYAPEEAQYSLLTGQWSLSGDDIGSIEESAQWSEAYGGIPVYALNITSMGQATLTFTAPDEGGLTLSIPVTSSEQMARELRLDKTQLELEPGATAQLSATLIPQTQDILFWSSSDTQVAVVSEAGLVTAVSVGEATITVCLEENTRLSALCHVTVTKTQQQPGQFTYELKDGGAVITGYTGSDTDLTIPASIEGHPVTAIGEKAFFKAGLTSVKISQGVERIEAKAFAQCAKLKEVSLPDSLTQLAKDAFNGCKKLPKVKKVALKVTQGSDDTLILCPVFTPSNTASDWSLSVSPKKGASCDNMGVVSVKSQDYFKLTLKADGKQAVLGVKDGEPYAASKVSINGKAKRTLKMGEVLKLNYQVTPASAQVVAVWTSADPEIATVSSDGLVTPVAPGKVKITLETDLGLTDSVTITVKESKKK